MGTTEGEEAVPMYCPLYSSHKLREGSGKGRPTLLKLFLSGLIGVMVKMPSVIHGWQTPW